MPVRQLTILMYCVLLYASILPAIASDDDVEAGGLLYDNWSVALKLKAPETTHPAYPASGKKQGSTTWRCKECHGWDYLGKDGAYASGSHYSGIPGILQAQNKSKKALKKILQDRNHGYDQHLSGEQIEHLVAFIRKGMIDMRPFINPDSRQASGNADNGKGTYKRYCLICHGGEGQKLNLSHKKGSTLYVGTISNKNPWEVLHKIRFGHPGATFINIDRHHGRKGDHHMGNMQGMMMQHGNMRPMVNELSVSEQVDLLSYMQGLPK